MTFLVYILESILQNRTYLGITNNLTRRLRQHNGEIAGGAQRTKTDRPWVVRATVSPFCSISDALRFEKYAHLLNSPRWKRRQKTLKNIPKRCRPQSSLDYRLALVNFLLTKFPKAIPKDYKIHLSHLSPPFPSSSSFSSSPPS